MYLRNKVLKNKIKPKSFQVQSIFLLSHWWKALSSRVGVCVADIWENVPPLGGRLDSPMVAFARSGTTATSRSRTYSRARYPPGWCPGCGRCQWGFRRLWSTASGTGGHMCGSTCLPWWSSSKEESCRYREHFYWRNYICN